MSHLAPTLFRNMKIILILAILGIIIVVAFSRYTTSKAQSESSSPPKILCDASQHVDCGKKEIPKGVCVPGGVCT